MIFISIARPRSCLDKSPSRRAIDSFYLYSICRLPLGSKCGDYPFHTGAVSCKIILTIDVQVWYSACKIDILVCYSALLFVVTNWPPSSSLWNDVPQHLSNSRPGSNRYIESKILVEVDVNMAYLLYGLRGIYIVLC